MWELMQPVWGVGKNEVGKVVKSWEILVEIMELVNKNAERDALEHQLKISMMSGYTD